MSVFLELGEYFHYNKHKLPTVRSVSGWPITRISIFFSFRWTTLNGARRWTTFSQSLTLEVSFLQAFTKSPLVVDLSVKLTGGWIYVFSFQLLPRTIASSAWLRDLPESYLLVVSISFFTDIRVYEILVMFYQGFRWRNVLVFLAVLQTFPLDVIDFLLAKRAWRGLSLYYHVDGSLIQFTMLAVGEISRKFDSFLIELLHPTLLYLKAWLFMAHCFAVTKTIHEIDVTLLLPMVGSVVARLNTMPDLLKAYVVHYFTSKDHSCRSSLTQSMTLHNLCIPKAVAYASSSPTFFDWIGKSILFTSFFCLFLPLPCFWLKPKPPSHPTPPISHCPSALTISLLFSN